jgi:hypothetical protein
VSLTLLLRTAALPWVFVVDLGLADTVIRRSLAWAEMYLVLAALVQRFSFTIEGVAASDFELDKDNFGIGTKAGCNLMARVDPYEG